ncbi:MAG: hypothetical protein ACRDOE_12885 [Streptosporangiaceae bacterium]
MHTPQPPHPVPALTTSELTRYQRQLEHAITAITPEAPVQASLTRKLGEVLAEQQSRAALTAAAGRARP